MVQSLAEIVKSTCKPLPDIDSKSFGSYFDTFANSRVVLIGDASHGTSEFYRARAAITKRLIEEHNFNIVAIEADWPDCHVIDNYVRQHPSSKGKTPMPVFKHFPEWMWRNEEMQGFIDWLRARNDGVPLEKRAGIYGMDLYSMGSSIDAVIKYLEKVDPDLAKDARRWYSCLQPWVKNPARYGREALHKGYAPCEAGVVKMLKELLVNRIELSSYPRNGESFLDAEMNARLVRDAEQYYRSMYWDSDQSWNLRDTHMFETLKRLLKVKGGKAVVWAHNSHLGDARATGMGLDRNELNIGQLCREKITNSGEVAIIGMGTHNGEVAAAEAWNGPMQVMSVNPSRKDSWERIMHETHIPSFLVDLRDGHIEDEAKRALEEEKLERFIGVIYRPNTERWSHYVESRLTKQFDAFVWFDRTSAVRPSEIAQPPEAISRGETYPFGL